MTIKIVTDSTADIPSALAKELFLELDPQGRGASTIPEYLKTYGNWVR